MGLIRRIGDGRTTGAWTDNWIPRDHRLKPICAMSTNPPQRVCDFMHAASKEWNIQALQSHFLPMDVDAIQQIPLSLANQTDCWACHYEKNDSFSVRSACRMLVETKLQRGDWMYGATANSNRENEEKNWRRLWKVRVPAKPKVFAWRLARASLPTGEVRKDRKMAQSAACPICNAAVDSWRHSLLDCNLAKSVWALREDDVSIPVFGDETNDAKLWLFGLSATLDSAMFVEVLVTLWAIRWARRRAIHEGEF